MFYSRVLEVTERRVQSTLGVSCGPPSLRKVLKGMEWSCFNLSDAIQLKYPLLRKPMTVFGDNYHEFQMDITSLYVLNIGRGDSFLCFRSKAGYTNQVAGNLAGPGCVNVGVEERIAYLQHSRNLSAAIFRRKPTLSKEATIPIFTNDLEAVLSSSQYFDKILVNYSADSRIEPLKLFESNIRQGGRLLMWRRDQRNEYLSVAELFERQEDKWVSLVSFNQQCPTGSRSRYNRVPENLPYQNVPYGTLSSLAACALRELCVIYNPAKRHIMGQSYFLKSVSSFPRKRFKNEKSIRLLATVFKRLVEVAYVDSHMGLNSNKFIPFKARSVELLETFIAMSLKITKSFYSNIFSEDWITDDVSQEPSASVLNAHTLFWRIITIMRILLIKPIKVGKLWKAESLVHDSVAEYRVNRYHRILYAAFYRRVMQEGKKQLLIHFDYDMWLTTRTVELSAARFVSDLRAVYRTLQLLLSRERLDQQKLLDNRSQLTDLIDTLRKAHGKCPFEVLEYCWTYFVEFAKIVQQVDEAITPYGDLNLLEYTNGVLRASLDANIVVRVTRIPKFSPFPFLSLHRRITFDANVFDEELKRLDSQMSMTMESVDELADFVAARLLDDCRDVIVRLRLGDSKVGLADLLTNPEVYVDSVLGFLPKHIRSFLIKSVDLSEVFHGENLNTCCEEVLP